MATLDRPAFFHLRLVLPLDGRSSPGMVASWLSEGVGTRRVRSQLPPVPISVVRGRSQFTCLHARRTALHCSACVAQGPCHRTSYCRVALRYGLPIPRGRRALHIRRERRSGQHHLLLLGRACQCGSVHSGRDAPGATAASDAAQLNESPRRLAISSPDWSMQERRFGSTQRVGADSTSTDSAQ